MYQLQLAGKPKWSLRQTDSRRALTISSEKVALKKSGQRLSDVRTDRNDTAEHTAEIAVASHKAAEIE